MKIERVDITDLSSLFAADVDETTLKAEEEGFRFLMLQNYCHSSMKEVVKVLVADRTVSHLYILN